MNISQRDLAGTAGAPSLNEQIIAVLRTIFDPELPVNIYELGLIYDIQASDVGDVAVQMTLTSPNCPVAESLPQQVKAKISEIPGVTSAHVHIVFDPPWTRERMSEAARFELECMGIHDPSSIHGSRPTKLTVGRTNKRT